MPGRIWQRGSPYLRATLYQIGFLSAQHCADACRLYSSARARGLEEVPATIHVANKINRVLFVLLSSQQPYRSPLTVEQEAHWLAVAASRRSRARQG